MICIDERWHQTYGQQGAGTEWTEWQTYEMTGGRKIGSYSFDSLDAAIKNAFDYAVALGIKTVQMRKEGKNVRKIKVTKTVIEEPC